MTTKPLTAALIIAALAGPSPAHAANVTLQTVCRNYPCVYDQNGRGQVLGYALYGGNAIRQETSGPGVGQWFDIGYNKNGVGNTFLFYHNNSSCTDQAYIYYEGEMPQNAQYDGQSLWAAIGEIETFTWSAYQYYDYDKGTSVCQPYGECYDYVKQQSVPCTGTGAPAVKIETKTWTPPLSFSPLDE